MKITVAVCTYRRFDWLKTCLEELKKQTISQDQYTLLVIDNSLQPEESLAFRDSLQGFENLEYVITEKCGIAFARNEALRLCKTDILAFTDDDCLVKEDWLQNILEIFSRYSEGVAAIGGKVKPLWEEEPPPWLTGDLLGCLALIDWGEEEFLIEDMHTRWLITANEAYRTAALRKAGGFPEQLGRKRRLPLAQEEFAANQALRTCGYEILYTPLLEVSHFIPAARVTKTMLCRDAFWEGVSQALYRKKGLSGEDTDKLADGLFPLQEELLAKLEGLKGKEDIENKRIELRQKGLSEAGKLLREDTTVDPLFTAAWPVIYLVTPCFNAVDTIDQTIQSIVSQAGNFTIRYHVQDGGSTDGTLDKLELWSRRLKDNLFPLQCNNLVFTYQSSPDQGMYDALIKGFNNFAMPYNAFMTWLNADDLLMPGALALVYAVSQQFKPEEISWLTGQCAVYKDNIQIARVDRPTPTEVIKSGLCEEQHWHFIQQEGTFFRNWLWEKVNALDNIRKYKYAGDWNLWRLFAHNALLVEVDWPLGAFQLREGQLSQKYHTQYMEELDQTISPEERACSLRELSKSSLRRAIIVPQYPTEKFKLIYEKVDNINYWYQKVFKKWPKHQPSGGAVNYTHELKAASFKGSLQDKRVEDSPGLLVFSSPVIQSRKDEEYDLGEIQLSGETAKTINLCTNKAKTIFILTPCLNAVNTIDQTILSVISQAGDFNICYHVQDGGSTDGTLDKLKQWSEILSKDNPYIACQEIKFSWTCQQDHGLYDALGKGFNQMAIGHMDFMTWLNSDDLLLPDALASIADISEQLPAIEWVGTPQYVIDNQDNLTLYRLAPTPVELIREGICDNKHWYMLQQEGTFFKRSLWFKARHALEKLQLAGDWNLWRIMARYGDYYHFAEPLGAFRKREGQLSVIQNDKYMDEINSIISLQERKARFKKFYNDSKGRLYGNLLCKTKQSADYRVEKDYNGVSKTFELFWQLEGRS